MTEILVAAELAGSLTAHAIWCVSEGDVLTPIFGYFAHDGKRHFERLITDKLEDGVAFGKEMLADNPHNAIAAVLIFDGYVTLETSKTDALIVEFRAYPNRTATVVVVLPYRAASNAEGFAVHRPKIRELHSVSESQVPEIMGAFFSGVESHERGSKVWNAHSDESR